LVIASFSVASVIVLESTLSFLGIGLPIEEVSWGSLMAQGRNNVSSWWLTLFPGLCIFIVVLCINELTDRTIKIDE
jgi:peptide/nickel transport system permease protein